MAEINATVPQECPRCQASFICQAAAISKCQCNGIQLRQKVRAWIQQHYPHTCLCRKCLEELSR